jgi:hypothetical protein
MLRLLVMIISMTAPAIMNVITEGLNDPLKSMTRSQESYNLVIDFIATDIFAKVDGCRDSS